MHEIDVKNIQKFKYYFTESIIIMRLIQEN